MTQNNGRLFHENGTELKKGDIVEDFRGDKWILDDWRAPLHAGSTGRVYLRAIGPGGNWTQEFFPGVIKARIVLK